MMQDSLVLCKYTSKLRAMEQKPAAKKDLTAMAGLTKNITGSLEKVLSFAQLESKRRANQPKQPESAITKCSRHSNCIVCCLSPIFICILANTSPQQAKMVRHCYLCGTTNTPRWRNDP